MEVGINHELYLVYSQSGGHIWLAGRQDRWTLLGCGYSGYGEGKNDPDREGDPGVGPIPRGVWKVASVLDHPQTGPLSIRLRPVGHDAHHRSGFLIHGDAIASPGTASTGCIIASRGIREAIIALKVDTLEVIL